ncbi:MAG TPA: Asp-tRNA(Asn)/Glu-tRNA(Gln) amidotransferase subunit GatC, partial [Chitinophagaceae bacterium]|nr:Asp-tRNA(Asn)/Glu-tRNA(Gln) amidotransferase subunit GatC [Chitinophagaceae bacterium]
MTTADSSQSTIDDKKLTTHNSQFPYTGPIAYICRMEVNDELIDKLAHLARLEFNAEEKEEIKEDLRKMIGFIDK